MVLAWPELFPPVGLVLRVGDGLELRYATDDLLSAVAEVAHDGVHDMSWTPFGQPWANADPIDRARSVIKWNWAVRSRFTAEDWTLAFAVLDHGQVVGLQDLGGRAFAVCREVHTGSWLGMAHQGRGIGTRMRRAVLSFAFDHLGALSATSGAWKDNAASQRVSEKIGYLPDGEDVELVRGERREGLRYRLTVERWRSSGHRAVEVEGLGDACREALGASAA